MGEREDNELSRGKRPFSNSKFREFKKSDEFREFVNSASFEFHSFSRAEAVEDSEYSNEPLELFASN